MIRPSPLLLPVCRNSRGMALLMTLCAVVLVTALIISFFSNSLLNRRIAYSNTNMAKADQLAHSALEIVSGEIREEIADPSYSRSSNGGSTTYPAFYRPLAASNAIPQKVGVSGTSTTHLFKVSVNNSAINPGSNGRKMGSAISISTASHNGRFISTDRWFGSSGPALGTNNALPTWVYITRSGVKTTDTPDDVADPKKSDYVIGRFAYTVYNQGGLLDANIAGYPAAASSNVPFKSSLAFADIGGVLGITGLASWRNSFTGTNANTFAEWATGQPSISGTSNSGSLAAAASGHLLAVGGDNVFFSRHDLLLAAKNSIAGLNTTQVGNLTHFSRALNAPSWAPATVTVTNPDLGDVRFQNPTDLIHYNDAGVSGTDSVLPGDSLIQRRFSLAKVGWITASGPRSGISAAAIQSCFGLSWNATQTRWDYVGASGTDVQPSIETLDQVAKENREPNFFELLKAGILAGSLGKASDNKTLAQSDQQTLEGSKDFQIFQIGVNIIDCAGADNYPTTVAYAVGGVPIVAHGVKDLPYFYGAFPSLLARVTYIDATKDRMDWCSMVIVPELFNPHAAGVASTAGPSNLRVRIASASAPYVYASQYGAAPGATLARLNLNLNLTSRPPIVIPSSGFEAFRSAMKPIRNTEASSSTTLNTLVGPTVVSATSSDIHAFLYYTYTGLPETYNKPASTMYMGASVSNFLIVLEYQDASNNWHIYDTWTGNESFLDSGTGLGNKLGFQPTVSALSSGTWTSSNIYGGGTLKLDPRTTRFGLSVSNWFGIDVTSPVASGGGAFWNGLTASLPFGSAGWIGNGICYPGAWLQGGKTGWTSTTYADNVADSDGKVRPADGWLGAGANFFSNVAATSNTKGRPLILHRPYRSVAELGYVFRATPWKTLNFFDDASADGALLDLFSVSDEPHVVAGRIELNSAEATIQQALLNGVGQSFDGTSPLPSASDIATAYQTYAYSSGSPTTTQPINLAQLPSFMSSSNLTSAYATTSTPIKYYRESVVRALTAGTQTRTWNLLIDVVAQAGRFRTGTTPSSLADFIVDGEKRYWLSIAIDRYTGEIVDEQLEAVHE